MTSDTLGAREAVHDERRGTRFGDFQRLFLGSFTSKCSNGGVTERLGASRRLRDCHARAQVRYRGCFNGDPQLEGPIPNGLGAP